MSRVEGRALTPGNRDDLAPNVGLPRTLDQARLSRDSFVVLEGSQPGQTYLTCQAVLVVCWEPVLKLLLRDLDAIASPRRTPHACVRYERVPGGPLEVGGTGQASGLWIHERFVMLGLDRYIRAILKGGLGRIPLSERLRHTALNRVKYGAELARDRVLG